MDCSSFLSFFRELIYLDASLSDPLGPQHLGYSKAATQISIQKHSVYFVAEDGGCVVLSSLHDGGPRLGE